MEKVKQFFLNKRSGFYFEVAAILFALIGLILFCVTMKLQQNMYGWIVAIMCISLLAGIVCCYKDFFGAVSIVAAVLYFLSGLFFLATQLENIGYAITHTNIGDGIMPSFLAGMVMYAFSLVLAISAAFFPQERRGEKNN